MEIARSLTRRCATAPYSATEKAGMSGVGGGEARAFLLIRNQFCGEGELGAGASAGAAVEPFL